MMQAATFTDLLARFGFGEVDVLERVAAALRVGVEGLERGVFCRVMTRANKRGGKVYPSEVVPNAYAFIVRGESIILLGARETRKGRIPYLRQYTLGDLAEYDSWNMSYYGRIVAIGEKTVTIEKDDDNGRTVRLALDEFSRRNCRFDVLTARGQNLEVMMTC